MRKLCPMLVVLVAVFLFVPAPALAQGAQDFTLVNKTGVTIEELYISPTTTDEWDEDVLGVDTLPDGEEVEINFDRKETACKWDIKIKDSDGDEVEWFGVNLCKISKVTLYWKDGKAWASVE